MNFLGIDGGGSKTTFLLEDEIGRAIAHFETGSSNWLSAGPESARRSIADGIARLPATPDVVCGGFAGAGRAEGLDFYRDTLTALLPHARILIETDAAVAYFGALGSRSGVLLIAGTGSIAVARTDKGRMVRAGGWGPWFSDEGSGFWIGQEAIRTALRAHDSESSPDFVALIVQSLGLRAITDVPAAWRSGAVNVRSVASLAPVVTGLYPAEPARRILTEAAAHLRSLAEAAARGAGLGGDFPRAVAGSIGAHPTLRDLIGLDFTAPANTPARGAILLARDRITAS